MYSTMEEEEQLKVCCRLLLCFTEGDNKESRCAGGILLQDTFSLFFGMLVYQGGAPRRTCDCHSTRRKGGIGVLVSEDWKIVLEDV